MKYHRIIESKIIEGDYSNYDHLALFACCYHCGWEANLSWYNIDESLVGEWQTEINEYGVLIGDPL